VYNAEFVACYDQVQLTAATKQYGCILLMLKPTQTYLHAQQATAAPSHDRSIRSSSAAIAASLDSRQLSAVKSGVPDHNAHRMG
jgi:hypothetical protein